jgi:hypothetical protein
MNTKIAAYIEAQPAAWQPLLHATCAYILQQAPGLITENYRFKTPFFDYCGEWLCYISGKPTAKCPWITVGFMQGHKLSPYPEMIHGESLKQVRHVYIRSLSDLQDERLRWIFQEAMMLIK